MRSWIIPGPRDLPLADVKLIQIWTENATLPKMGQIVIIRKMGERLILHTARSKKDFDLATTQIFRNILGIEASKNHLNVLSFQRFGIYTVSTI